MPALHRLAGTLLLAACALAAAPVLAREISGVQVPDRLQVAGKTLELNGAGLRKKFVVKVYVGALYLATASKDPAAVIAADAPKSVRMAFVREVEKKQILGAFREGFENNSRDRLPSLLPKLALIEPVVPDAKPGTVLQVTYVPGQGTTVSVEGGGSVTVEGKDFADALFANWLGEDPADGGLKEAMLGGS